MSEPTGTPSLPPTPATPGYTLSALPWRARLARAVRRALRIDKERRWNREFSEGKWQWLHGLDELAHHGVLAAYICQCKPNARVLDVGCGSGTLFDQLRGGYASYVGIDYAEPVKLAAATRTSERSTFIAADMNEFTPAGQFDVIVFNESIYYLVDLLDGLKRYEGMMAPDALFVVSMHGQPRNLALWAQIDSTYQILDAVTITNQRGVQWTCKVFRR